MRQWIGLGGCAIAMRVYRSNWTYQLTIPTSIVRNYLSVYRSEKFRFKVNMYKLKEEREIEPRTLAHLVSSTLYERR